ncbi:MAG: hypothetical protein JGK10_17860 [Microcoleus sp. PH2017_13_LAR_U_A]|nr:hypothetical protein [Microcoleus sp. PH2017_13_LAR_U_A]MCC3486008.1 hypothetical protein [Microcoleus sp. PH2017_14_LAR_D_A]
MWRDLLGKVRSRQSCCLNVDRHYFTAISCIDLRQDLRLINPIARYSKFLFAVAGLSGYRRFISFQRLLFNFNLGDRSS